MARCEATTKKDNRCLNLADYNHRFCKKHKNYIDSKRITLVSLGLTVGFLLPPAILFSPLLAFTGYKAGNFKLESDAMPKRVFVSFDFDNDRQLKDFIIGQSRLADSPFQVIDHSLKEAAPERDWERKAETAIARSDIVVVMVGQHTHRAPGVLKEVEMARKRGIQIVQIIGYKDGNYTAVPNAGRLYSWNWENLKKLLS